MKKCYATHANSLLLLKDLKSIHSNTFYTPNGVDEELFRPISAVKESLTAENRTVKDYLTVRFF
jgi:hypothetical protein